jgi:flagellar motor component MotA
MADTKCSIHVSYLQVLYLVMQKVRYQGMMSIESDIEAPRDDASVFSRYPEIFDFPEHADFMIDTLRVMSYGMQEASTLSVFAATAKKALQDAGGEPGSLWDCIWVTLYALAQGCAPSIAIEFGRQAILPRERPTFAALEAQLKSVGRDHGDGPDREGIDTAVDVLFERINAR